MMKLTSLFPINYGKANRRISNAKAGIQPNDWIIQNMNVSGIDAAF